MAFVLAGLAVVRAVTRKKKERASQFVNRLNSEAQSRGSRGRSNLYRNSHHQFERLE
jgi:hypothetical protein